MGDRALLLALLNSNALTDLQRTFFQGELAKVELGMVRKLSPVNRRHAEAIARAKGIMPSRQDGYKKPLRVFVDNLYSDRHTPGTDKALEVLAVLPKAPPGRRCA